MGAKRSAPSIDTCSLQLGGRAEVEEQEERWRMGGRGAPLIKRASLTQSGGLNQLQTVTTAQSLAGLREPSAV